MGTSAPSSRSLTLVSRDLVPTPDVILPTDSSQSSTDSSKRPPHLSQPSPDPSNPPSYSSHPPPYSSEPRPQSSKHPPGSSDPRPQSSKPPPDSSDSPLDSPKPPLHSSKPFPDPSESPPESSKSSQGNSHLILLPSDLPSLPFPSELSKVLSDVPPEVSKVLSAISPGVSKAISDVPSVITKVVSDATPVVSLVFSDASAVVSTITQILPVFVPQVTHTSRSTSKGGSVPESTARTVTHNTLSSAIPTSTTTSRFQTSPKPLPLLSTSQPSRMPSSITSPLPSSGSQMTRTTLPAPNGTASTGVTTVSTGVTSVSTGVTTVSTGVTTVSTGVTTSSKLTSAYMSSPSGSETIPSLVSSLGLISPTPLMPTVSPTLSKPTESASITAPSPSKTNFSASRSNILAFTDTRSGDSSSTLVTVLPSSTHLNSTLTTISGSISSSKLGTAGPQSLGGSHGSDFSSTSIPLATKGRANVAPTPGFFNRPAMVAGTFTAVVVVVVAAAVGVLVLTRLRGRHRRALLRVPNNDPDEEEEQDMRQRSLQTNTHRSVVSYESILPSLEDSQATPLQTSLISEYQAFNISETMAARNSWNMVPNSRSPTSPVDPVDPHGWPLVSPESERSTQPPRVSPEPYSVDPDTRAAMGWIMADEATLESISEDERKSASLLNLGYGTRPIRS